MDRFVIASWLSSGWLFALLTAGFAGCAHRESIGRFSEQPVAPFSESGTQPIAQRWWTELGDPELNARVQQALSGNYDLAAALQRVAAARALARRQASDFFPDLNGVADAQSIFGPGEDRFPSVIGLDANYIVDLWGRIDALVEAERLRASATNAEYQAISLFIAAEVTRNWLALIEANAQLELLDKQIETNRLGLDLQEARFGEGVVRSPDVLRQRQLLESTLEQYAVAQSQIETLEHSLATLLGELPQTAQYAPGTQLPELPPLPATGLPAELLRRRPDVRRDYLAFAAADRDLAAAVSDQFPRLNLTGSLLNVADRPSDLFRDWFLSIGSSLVGPILDGGQRRAEVDRTAAVTRLRYNEYGQTMLIAFREVEDALVQERYQVERLNRLNRQVELARQSSDLLFAGYQIGEQDYLAVLTATTALQRLQRETLSAQLELRLIRVSLYLALAGGFDPRIPASVGDLTSVVDNEPEPAEMIPAGDAQADEDAVLPTPDDRTDANDDSNVPEPNSSTTDAPSPRRLPAIAPDVNAPPASILPLLLSTPNASAPP